MEKEKKRGERERKGKEIRDVLIRNWGGETLPRLTNSNSEIIKTVKYDLTTTNPSVWLHLTPINKWIRNHQLFVYPYLVAITMVTTFSLHDTWTHGGSLLFS